MKVRVQHYRYTDILGKRVLLPRSKILEFEASDRILAKGGRTFASLLDEDGKEIEYGVAVCSKKDNYSKKIGRMIATGRALKKLESRVKS